MQAADARAAIQDHVAALARRHEPVSGPRVAYTLGRRLELRLGARFDAITARISELPTIRDAQLVGLDWLEQNQHVIREAISQVGGSVPRGHAHWLPVVRATPGHTELRVQAIAESIVERAALPLDIDGIERFLTSYQHERSLTLGELWALPTLLRADIVKRLCDTAVEALEFAGTDSNEQERPPTAARLSAYVISLRVLDAADWLRIVEHQSIVEQTLARDPCGSYPRMSPDSRNRYREQVEHIARASGRPESDVAEAAVNLSRNRPAEARQCEAHVGYYLVDSGVDTLIAAFDKMRLRRKVRRIVSRWKSRTYIAAIALLAAGSLAWLSSVLLPASSSPALGWVIVALATVPILSIWSEIVNWLITQAVRPQILPRLDLSGDADYGSTTAVVMPCLLSSITEIDRLISNLERNYLGNSNPALIFVLLSDFTDADDADLEEDSELLQHAQAGIRSLNLRHANGQTKPFALLHRRRVWNANAGAWMGWERKRGKIAEFNQWLLGSDQTSFTVFGGAAESLRPAKYVITLDADTQLLPGVAGELIGAIDHPLNSPEIDPDTGRLVAGYTIIQPRVELNPASANRTLFSRLMSGNVGIDLYHIAVSEAYHDFFRQCIYAGKGIYDVHAFQTCVEGVIPCDMVLSHDLLEGVLGRTALSSDTVVLENAPPNLVAELRRQHRWTRGDWQLLPWLVGAGRKGTRISPLGRWMMFDNLRRSLLPLTLIALFFTGWFALPGHRVAWTIAVASVPGLRVLWSLANDMRHSSLRWGTLRSTLIRLGTNLSGRIGQWFFNLAVLPVVAASNLDAITRTLARLFVTHRRLLEWAPAAQSDSGSVGISLARSYRLMVAAPLTGILACVTALSFQPVPGWTEFSLGMVWAFAPWLAWALAREPEEAGTLDASAHNELRKIARRTWQFYERFVGPESHWLPPDNYQETPKVVIAERTSPSNIGLFLTSAVAAFDLQYIGPMGLLTRLNGTIETLSRMQQFRGHLFNWYDTRDLSVLAPAYVSTVDSGNLVAALLVCRSAVLEIKQAPLPHLRAAIALGDIISNIEDVMTTGGQSDESKAVLRTLARVRHRMADAPPGASGWHEVLDEIEGPLCTELDDAVLRLHLAGTGHGWTDDSIETLRIWVNQLHHETSILNAEVTDMILGCKAMAPGSYDGTTHRPRTLGDYLQTIDGALGASTGARVEYPPESERTADAALRRHIVEIDEMLDLRNRLLARIDEIIDGTDFAFLFDTGRQLFHIGYNNTTGELDPGHYDLLASEARIASLIAIAKSDVPIAHWVHLGRPLRRLGGMRVVLSWSATAFEYLMPRLFMETPAHGLLDASCRAVVREQRKLGKQLDRPWGFSESAYFDLDAAHNFKYFAFGIDSLALRHTTHRRYVVAPYASMLALPFDPVAVIKNLESLSRYGCWDRYGFYEALDFSEQESAAVRPRIVRSYMAHHQGMIMAALANALCRDTMLRRFHANPEIAAVEHLLYEALPKRAEDRIIRYVAPQRRRAVPMMTSDHVKIQAAQLDRFVNLLGNGHMTVRTTALGSGDILWNNRAITRWQPRTSGPLGGDRTYLSDHSSGELHVLGSRNTVTGTAPECWCAPHETDLHEHFGSFMARLTIGVAPDNDVAFRRITVTNDSASPRRISLTHYAEIVLAPVADDQRHPAFNKLFIRSEFVAAQSALVFSRRRRRADEPGLCCAVGITVPPEYKGALHYTCNRQSFIGRSGSYRNPAALSAEKISLDDDVRSGLDPVAAIGVTLTIPAGETAQVTFITSAAPTLAHALEMIDHYRSPHRINHSLNQARQQAAADLTELSMESTQLMQVMETYADLLWPHRLTPSAYASARNTQSVLGVLWSRGISGDLPICTLRVTRTSDTSRVEEILALQNFLGRRSTHFDVILIDESPAGYAENVRNRLDGLVDRYHRQGQRGSVFVLRSNTLSPGERAALDVAALVHIHTDPADSVPLRQRRDHDAAGLPAFVPVRRLAAMSNDNPLSLEVPKLDFDNGYGGVDTGTGEYVIRASPSRPTPAPWINVLANPEFGSLVSESGSGYTWFHNSSEHRLTAWHNDPVTDRSGEAVYVRDEETGEFWSPTPKPRPGGNEYLLRHGAGYSTFQHLGHCLEQRMDIFVDPQRSLKFLRLSFRNLKDQPRRLTVTYFVEWVFGNHYEDTSPYIIPDIDDGRQILLARNAHPRFHKDRTAFVTATRPLHGFTTDRREFLGEERDLSSPAALQRIGLSGNIVAGAEPCCALQIHVDLGGFGETRVAFVLGAEKNRAESIALAGTVQTIDDVDARFAITRQYWSDMLACCTIHTPNAALDYLFNRWLAYQNLVARFWARTGLYQSAGGFGFRDQLQDALAIVHIRPDLAREHILRACRVQFTEGDVLHWWHEGPIRGVRSRCSDDLLWLPYTVSEYLTLTGDSALLDENVPYLAGEPLAADEDERYTEYQPSDRSTTVYAHCCAAIDARSATGRHGLPLIGSGDWNDGLDRVGAGRRGESAWLGWFLADVCNRFTEIARQRGETARVTRLTRQREQLVTTLESSAWDDEWYLRAYYDDGTPLGTKHNKECRIDLNAQTWPAITGLGAPDRANSALDSAAERLIDEDNRLIKLLEPPFDQTLRDPGYIKGYPPGVRENGGQYTHAAVWAVQAACALNRPEQAVRWADLLNPLLRVQDRDAADHYRGEPYVLAGDVGGAPPYTGRAGWTWYTGSAGWFYRIILEQILGLKLDHGEVRLQPQVPDDWSAFEIRYRVGDSIYLFEVHHPAALGSVGARIELDGHLVETLRLLDDKATHHVAISPRSRSSSAARPRTDSEISTG